VDPSFPAATAGVLYAVLVYLAHYRTEKQRQQTAEAFGRYLSPKMAERVSRDRNALKLGGDERVLTVMFADARGFTALSERYAGDPQTLTGIVNRFLSAMSNEIQRLDGTVDKYMGDAVMAFWNAPEDQADHAVTACRAALAMQDAIARLNEAWQTDPEFAGPDRTPPRIGVGVGVNTGRCVVGNMGSESRLEYSVIGDPVNLASRIESQTKSYRVPIMITEATQREAPTMAALEIDRIAVKGKAEAVTVYALLGDETVAASDAFKSLQSMQAGFLAAYRGQRWDEAEAQADALARSNPTLSGLYALFRTRIAELRANPPGADWDGVFIAVEK
jgi:adenylate cyclase